MLTGLIQSDADSVGAMPSHLSCASATTQDVTAGEGSEYDDSGIDGVTADAEHQSRRYKTMSASFSVSSVAGRSMFAGSDSGSSSGGGGGGGGSAAECVQGVYENFRQELEMSSCQTESLEEAGSALSDEQSTMSSAYQSDPLLSVVQGMVRKAGRLAVKNFLVHKKNKKVESAARRKWKSYWVSLKGWFCSPVQHFYFIPYSQYTSGRAAAIPNLISVRSKLTAIKLYIQKNICNKNQSFNDHDISFIF